MYSYEERLRAVDLYLKLGKRSRATIRQLGYPTKNSLRHWYQEFLEYGDLQADYVRSKEKYSVDQKDTAIEHYMNHGRCFSATLDALGYPSRRGANRVGSRAISEKQEVRCWQDEQTDSFIGIQEASHNVVTVRDVTLIAGREHK